MAIAGKVIRGRPGELLPVRGVKICSRDGRDIPITLESVKRIATEIKKVIGCEAIILDDNAERYAFKKPLDR